MLTQIIVGGENSFSLSVLGATPKDSIIVRKITGLNPPDLDLFIGAYSRDGGRYQGRRAGNRNPVFTFDLNPNYALGETISGLREFLYKAFMDPLVDADHVQVTLVDDDNRNRYFVGYVEKFETDIFDVETMAQISMVCPDPYIRNNIAQDLTNSSGWTVYNFPYTGTAETGFEAQIHLTGVTGVLTLENNGKKMISTRSYLATDVVYVNTVRGQRAFLVASSADVSAYTSAQPGATITQRWVALKELGQATSIVATLSATSPWIELHSQANLMKVYGATTGVTPAALKQLKYVETYWGV